MLLLPILLFEAIWFQGLLFFVFWSIPQAISPPVLIFPQQRLFFVDKFRTLALLIPLDFPLLSCLNCTNYPAVFVSVVLVRI